MGSSVLILSFCDSVDTFKLTLMKITHYISILAQKMLCQLGSPQNVNVRKRHNFLTFTLFDVFP